MSTLYYKSGGSWKTLDIGQPYPVGTYVFSSNNTSPASLVGGTWRSFSASLNGSVVSSQKILTGISLTQTGTTISGTLKFNITNITSVFSADVLLATGLTPATSTQRCSNVSVQATASNNTSFFGDLYIEIDTSGQLWLRCDQTLKSMTIRQSSVDCTYQVSYSKPSIEGVAYIFQRTA